MEKYKKRVYEYYKEEIDKFFEGEEIESFIKDTHIWICDHGDFQTLTVEPKKGEWKNGQYEIAVRFKLPTIIGYTKDYIFDKYAGYIARDGYMIGRNTSGH